MMAWLGLGGYGIYVWPVYGAAILILGGMTLAALTRHSRAERRLGETERRR